jgi:signal transduction histidine kinase
MKDKYIIPLFIAGTFVLTLFGLVLTLYIVIQKRKQNAYAIERAKTLLDHQNNILRTKIEEQEHTMGQISKELHDNVKSRLGFAQMSMYQIADLATDSGQALKIEKANKMIEEAINELHNISHSLNSTFVENEGLAQTIEKELENVRLFKNVSCHLHITGDPVSLAPQRELHVFRIAQEAIQNCMKHAKATSINFTLDYSDELLVMTITDNGRGFDKQQDMKGLGFVSMAQRARYIHGTLEVTSAPAKGTSVVLTLKQDSDGADN